MSPPCESFLTAEQLNGAGALLSRSTSGSATQCCLVQLPDYVTPGGHLHRVRLLLQSSPTPGSTHCRRLRATTHDRPLGLGRRQPRRRGRPATTATSSSYFVAQRRPGARASSRPRNVAAAAVEARACRPLVEFFGERPAPSSWWPRAGGLTSSSATTSSPRCRTSTTSWPASPMLLAPDGHGDHRVPAPRAAHRGQPVRHDLPRALLLLLAAHAPSASSPRHGLADLRRRGALDPRRLAAHLRRATTATPRSRSPSASTSSGAARRRARLRVDLDGLRALRGAGARDEATPPGVR